VPTQRPSNTQTHLHRRANGMCVCVCVCVMAAHIDRTRPTITNVRKRQCYSWIRRSLIFVVQSWPVGTARIRHDLEAVPLTSGTRPARSICRQLKVINRNHDCTTNCIIGQRHKDASDPRSSSINDHVGPRIIESTSTSRAYLKPSPKAGGEACLMQDCCCWRAVMCLLNCIHY